MIDPRHIEAGVRVYCGDCRLVMPQLPDPDCSVDSVVTDPPYELGFMGKGWDRSGVAYDVSVWRECLRLLKPGGHLLAFGGSRTYHRLACAIEDAGFEIRDQIQWLYGSGFPKSLDVSKAIDAAAGAEREIVGANPYNARRPNPPVSELHQQAGWPSNVTAPNTDDAAKQWSGWGTALKPAHEPIVMARKPLIGTVVENVLKHGTGGLNIDGCRVEGIDPANQRRLGKQYGDGGSATFGQIRVPIVGGTDLGRWPANVIHDGSDEVLAGFPETSSGIYSGKRNEPKTKNAFGAFVLRDEDPATYGDSGSAARFFYCAKASKEDREEGLESFPIRSAGNVTDRKDGSDGLNSPRAGAGRTNGSRNFHPTVKPTDLMRYLVRLITPPGGTVLDPFCGSGSTGKATALEQMNAILIDREAEYCDLAAARSRRNQGLLTFG